MIQYTSYDARLRRRSQLYDGGRRRIEESYRVVRKLPPTTNLNHLTSDDMVHAIVEAEYGIDWQARDVDN